MIEEAKVLGAAPVLRIDAVKACSNAGRPKRMRCRWTGARSKSCGMRFANQLTMRSIARRQSVKRLRLALGERDRVVLDAAKALEAANASGDAQKIRSAMNALEAALHGQAQAKAVVQAPPWHEKA
jgi:ATP-dependent RNA helicase SUPV3L1/SUV3